MARHVIKLALASPPATTARSGPRCSRRSATRSPRGGAPVTTWSSSAAARSCVGWTRWASSAGRARSRTCRPPARWGRGGCFAAGRAAGRARRHRRAGAADVLRPQPPHPLPQRAPDAAAAAGLGRRPDHQRERHDRDRRDHLRRQRLPCRAGRDPGRGRPAAAADRRRRRLHCRPRTDPSASIVREITDFATLEAQASIGDSTSALGSGGMRSKVVAAEMATAAGIPAAIVNGLRHEALGAVLAGATDEGTHFPARALGISSFKLWLRYAKPAAGTVVVDAGAARHCARAGRRCCPSASPTSTASSSPATPSRSSPSTTPRSWARASSRCRQPTCGGSRACSPHRSARCFRARPPRPCTATTSSWPETWPRWPLPFLHGVSVASVTDRCPAASAASRRLAMLPTAEKDAALLAIADALEARTVEIIEANARDLEAGREAGLSDALLDRLLLDPSGSPRSPRRCATSPRCRIRLARSSTGSGCPTAWTSPRRGRRSVSSRWSTRRGRT